MDSNSDNQPEKLATPNGNQDTSFVSDGGKIDAPRSALLRFHDHMKETALRYIGTMLFAADVCGALSAFFDKKEGENPDSNWIRLAAGMAGIVGNTVNIIWGTKKKEGQEYAGDSIPLIKDLPDALRPDKNPLTFAQRFLFLPGATLYSASFTNAQEMLKGTAEALQVTNIPGFAMGAVLLAAISLMAFMPENILKPKAETPAKLPTEDSPGDIVIENPQSQKVGVAGKALGLLSSAGKGLGDALKWLVNNPMQTASLLLKPVSILGIVAGVQQENIPLTIMGSLFLAADLTRLVYVKKKDYAAKPASTATERLEHQEGKNDESPKR